MCVCVCAHVDVWRYGDSRTIMRTDSHYNGTWHAFDIRAAIFIHATRGLSVSATALAPSGVSFTHTSPKMLDNRQWAVEARSRGRVWRGAADDNRQPEWRRNVPIRADARRHEATRMLHLMLGDSATHSCLPLRAQRTQLS